MQTALRSFRPLLPACLGLLLLGWGGLLVLFFALPPTVWARWAFFACLVLALSGTAMPVTYFLNRRFPSDPPAGTGVIVRQANWIGLLAALLAWLSGGGLLTVGTALILAGSLAILEWLLRQLERSQRVPRPVPPPEPSLRPPEPPDGPLA